MGARLALEAVAYCNLKSIQPVPRVLLMYMALRALDDDSAHTDQLARRSFLRRSEMGLALGRFMPDREPDADAPLETRRKWEADDQAIVRALRALKSADAIRQVGVGRNGRTVEYDIHLGRVKDAHRPPETDAQRPPTGRSVSFSASLTVPPIRTDEPPEPSGGQLSATQAPYVEPVDNFGGDRIAV